MTLYQRLVRWLMWKRMSKQQRLFVAYFASNYDPDCWETQQLKKESK